MTAYAVGILVALVLGFLGGFIVGILCWPSREQVTEELRRKRMDGRS